MYLNVIWLIIESFRLKGMDLRVEGSLFGNTTLFITFVFLTARPLVEYGQTLSVTVQKSL